MYVCMYACMCVCVCEGVRVCLRMYCVTTPSHIPPPHRNLRDMQRRITRPRGNKLSWVLHVLPRMCIKVVRRLCNEQMP